MFRHIRFSTSDYYCRYLNIGINSQSSNNICNGRFWDFLEKSLDIKRLPYNIRLIDLILEGYLDCDLFVRIPNEYFFKWKDYPFIGGDLDDNNDEIIKYASYYELSMDFEYENEFDLSQFGHPYDLSLKNDFVERFSVPIPSELENFKHANGYSFYPYEAYFSYWRAYLILESLEECKFIDRYLDTKKGIEIFKNSIKKKNELWRSKYSPTFNRLSQYKTIITQITISNKVNCSLGDISNHVLNLTNSDSSDLELDLDLLLKLYDEWSWKFTKDNGLHSFKKALVLLKKDIYFLFEWLCGCGHIEKDLIKKWSCNDPLSRSSVQLTDVLDFEDATFSNFFEKTAPIYCKNINWITTNKVIEIYNRLEQHDCFAPWIRAFYDLHESINRKEEIEFTQPRVLDNLLIISIRTEILLRAIYSKVSGDTNPDQLRDMFNKLAEAVSDLKAKPVLAAIASSDNWSLTELRDKPANIYENIDSCKVGKKWSGEQKYFFQYVLRFVASRNYFAHHSYKDNELNSHINNLCSDVLIACLHTILYIDRSTV